MSRNNHIRNLPQLQRELALRRERLEQQEKVIKADAKDYIKKFSVFNLIKKFTTPKELINLDDKTNIVGKVMSVVVPLILNKTIFRGSGFLVKGLAALVGGKVGKSIDAENLTGAFNGIKSLFNKKAKKERDAAIAFADYGIPPDSETY